MIMSTSNNTTIKIVAAGAVAGSGAGTSNVLVSGDLLIINMLSGSLTINGNTVAFASVGASPIYCTTVSEVAFTAGACTYAKFSNSP